MTLQPGSEKKSRTRFGVGRECQEVGVVETPKPHTLDPKPPAEGQGAESVHGANPLGIEPRVGERVSAARAGLYFRIADMIM